MNPRATPRCEERRLIDRHFAARSRPPEETALRAQLPGCASCRGYYEAHMLYAELAPGRPRLADRLAAGLGVLTAPSPPAPAWLPSRRTGLVAFAAATACLALFATTQGIRGRDREDFGVRGVASGGAGPGLEIYRVTGDGATTAADGWMTAGDELAFAYRNPSGFSRVMIFGVGDRDDIYWFHPAWSDANQNPVAVPIEAGVGPFELPEAIQHEIPGERLRVVALFTNVVLPVRALEEAWRRGRFERDPPDSARIEVSLEVRR